MPINLDSEVMYWRSLLPLLTDARNDQAERPALNFRISGVAAQRPNGEKGTGQLRATSSLTCYS